MISAIGSRKLIPHRKLSTGVTATTFDNDAVRFI
jgi:hypothetical protein